MSDSGFTEDAPSDLPGTMDRVGRSSNALGISANAFANAMARAFTQATAGGKQLDDVLKSLALRLSSMAVRDAFKPLAKGLAGGLNDIFAGIFSGGQGTPGGFAPLSVFADGGVIRAP